MATRNTRSTAHRTNTPKSPPKPPSIGLLVLESVRDADEGLWAFQNVADEDDIPHWRDLDVFGGLSPEQQQKLRALTRQLWAEVDSVKWAGDHKQEWRGWVKDGVARVRIARGKLTRASDAIRAVLDYLPRLNVESAAVSEALARAIAVLDTTALDEAEAVIPSLKVTDGRRAMATLCDFFTRECGLPRNEAEVRVGKIGNHFWGWDVKVIEEYGGRETWKGCDAVRKAVSRRRPRRSEEDPAA